MSGSSTAPAQSYSTHVPDSLDGERLDKAIAALCEGISRTLARKVIGAGGVRINGRRVRVASRPVVKGDQLRVGVAPSLLESTPQFPLVVVAEGEGWCVVNKAHGQHVQGTAVGDVGTVERLVSLREKERHSDRSHREKSRVHLVHRLDAAASGLLVVATDERCAAALSEQLRHARMGREYLALVEGVPKESEGVIALPLGKGSDGKIVVDERGGKPASTRYRVRRVYGPQRLSLVEATLETGRTHQIRVHFAQELAPIVGDNLYGSRTPGTRLRLHAHRLTLQDPTTGEERVFVAPADPAFYKVNPDPGVGGDPDQRL